MESVPTGILEGHGFVSRWGLGIFSEKVDIYVFIYYPFIPVSHQNSLAQQILGMCANEGKNEI